MKQILKRLGVAIAAMFAFVAVVMLLEAALGIKHEEAGAWFILLISLLIGAFSFMLLSVNETDI